MPRMDGITMFKLAKEENVQPRLFRLFSEEKVDEWLTLSKPIETLYNSKSGIYQNEPMSLTIANIDNILLLNLAWFMNPQINTGISVQTTQNIDGLLMQRYKSESAIVESLDDTSI